MKMPRRKLSEEEKKQVWKKKIYTKLMNHETLNITEVAKLLNKKAGTIRSWELKGLIPKPNKDEETDRRLYRDWETDRKSTRLNSSHSAKSRMPSSA